MAEELIKKDFTAQITDAISSPNVPKVYANGFINGLGMGDVAILFKNAEQPVLLLNLSYTVAKTLAQKIGTLISALETATGNVIMTTDQISHDLKKGTE